MKRVFKAKMIFDTKSNHPDSPNQKRVLFEDMYTFDTDIFSSDCIEYIKRDMSLVAGGGYETNTIENVIFGIKEV